MRRSTLLLGLLALLVLLPLVVVITSPFHSSAPEWSHVAKSILPTHLKETGALLIIAVGLAVLFGVSTAWLVSTADFPLRGLFRWALVLPLALPTYISAITFAALLGPTGTLSGWIEET